MGQAERRIVGAGQDNPARPIAVICAELGAPYRSQGAQAAQIDVMMNGSRKHQSVERCARHHPLLVADKDEFDADPWMLNTPSGILDLHDLTMQPHGALMRMQTLVTPNYATYMNCEEECPRWMKYLHFAECDKFGVPREWVIPFLQRWAGYSLVGAIFDVFFLFIHGVPKAGKTAFLDVVKRLSHLYGKSTSKQFFMRGLDKRTFELYQFIKKRACFTDETPCGATWDELMLLTMLGNTTLSAEGKGKDFLDFESMATITITGNHKPKFVTSVEEAGIDRCMLMLTMERKVAENMPDDTMFARKLAEGPEGPAVLMWMAQGAMKGWQCLQATGSFFGADMVEPLRKRPDAIGVPTTTCCNGSGTRCGSTPTNTLTLTSRSTPLWTTCASRIGSFR